VGWGQKKKTDPQRKNTKKKRPDVRKMNRGQAEGISKGPGGKKKKRASGEGKNATRLWSGNVRLKQEGGGIEWTKNCRGRVEKACNACFEQETKGPMVVLHYVKGQLREDKEDIAPTSKKDSHNTGDIRKKKRRSG